MWRYSIIIIVLITISQSDDVRYRRQTSRKDKPVEKSERCTLPELRPNTYYEIVIPTNFNESLVNKFILLNVTCAKGYEVDGEPLWRCIKGVWRDSPTCKKKLDCGKLHGHRPLIFKGIEAPRTQVPWNVMIYDNERKQHICGGSLVSTVAVVSAAHCFLKNASVYEVAAGKIYVDWENLNDIRSQQKSPVLTYHIPPGYTKDTSIYFMDVAVVKLKNRMKLTKSVLPICLNFEKDFVESQLKPENRGMVAGWGLQSVDGLRSSQLHVTELQFIDAQTCEAAINSPQDPLYNLIPCDKFCAKGRDDGSSVCSGDSGAGLAFGQLENGINIYYLQGVVSSSLINGYACNVDTSATFTKLFTYKNFIERMIKEETND